MTMPTSGPGTGWTVIDQQEIDKIGVGNQVVKGYQVYFRTQYNSTGSVWIDAATYTADTVREAIIRQAATMDAVHTLQS